MFFVQFAQPTRRALFTRHENSPPPLPVAAAHTQRKARGSPPSLLLSCIRPHSMRPIRCYLRVLSIYAVTSPISTPFEVEILFVIGIDGALAFTTCTRIGAAAPIATTFGPFAAIATSEDGNPPRAPRLSTVILG